ncbi:hypothetical protein [Pelagibacterium montanilacus]|uniref:hypothetical protein n=1 Tax=Pelagibacterium montanilacus TaxID=2185280 RepID=UPI000F8C7847|nr:hypothetical protein [Pelagibacterium montanilacus]
MDDPESRKRFVSAHRLPVAVGALRVRAPGQPAGSAFVAQVLATRAPQPEAADARTRAATGAYRLTDRLDVKRMPMGYRKTMDA